MTAGILSFGKHSHSLKHSIYWEGVAQKEPPGAIRAFAMGTPTGDEIVAYCFPTYLFSLLQALWGNYWEKKKKKTRGKEKR